MAPSDFTRFYEELLPEAMSGADFLKEYGEHWDSATVVSSQKLFSWVGILLELKQG